jgi:hypothetical protein
MKWPSIKEMGSLVPLPPGYSLGRLTPDNIATLIAAIKRWHPDIAVGVASCYMREDFYLNRAYFEDQTERDILVILLMFNGEMVGMWSFERELEALALYGRILIIAPEHRGAKLSTYLLKGTDQLGRWMGAAFMYAMATLKIPNVQRALETAGYRLLGFFPGYNREEVAPGVVKRVYEAVYAKLLVPENEVLRPDPKNLTPNSKVLFELLFAEDV